MKETKKNVYALLVGINEYERAKLRGCVKDSQKMGDLLNSDLFSNDYQMHIKYLHDDEATRLEIISCWENHLGKARKGDVVLFYFSGHGTQETADPIIWNEEVDGKLEGLVCYDSLQTNLFLADKELRHLIHEVAKNAPHIVTIFDCCHSGENTKAYNGFNVTKKEIVYDKMGNKFPIRKWEDFYFHDKVDINELKDTDVALNKTLPQGNHIQLAACQSNQSAYETVISKEWGRGGVFTYTLIDILKRSRGVVTYHDLKSRIFHYIKNRYNQSPTIYVRGNDNQERYKIFLGRAQHSQPLYGNVIYNKDREAWILDLGAIHGISKQAKTVTIKADRKEVVGEIVKVHTSDTEIKPVSVLPKGDYQAFIFPFKSAPIGVFLKGGADEEASLNIFQKLIEEKGVNINIISNEEQADYTVQFGKEYYSITHPFDPYRPLVLPIKKDDPQAAEITFGHLYQISQWEFIKLLHNTERDSQLNPDALKIEFFDKEDHLISIRNDQIIREVSSPNDEEHIRIKLTNMSNRPLHVAVLYLGVNFEADSGLIETGEQLLNKNDFIWLGSANNDKWITYGLDASRYIFNWKDNTTYLKFIISTQRFNVDNLALKTSLPDPTELLNKSKEYRKGIKMNTLNANADKWTTRLVALTISNPSYNKISLDDLKNKLQSPGADFFAGLYLKEGIQVSE